jgi:hypothetical protein
MNFTGVWVLAIGVICAQLAVGQVDYFEDFNSVGEPSAPGGLSWYYKDDMLPNNGWNDFCPGDGYAHITFDADKSNDTDDTSPFQDMGVGKVGPGHRLEMRAKGAAVSGVGGFIFTYFEDTPYGDPDKGIDEIDIEIVPDDKITGGGYDHQDKLLPPDGWSDARFNTWANSDYPSYLPKKSIKQPIMDKDGNKVSHIDDAFHVYTIEWEHDPSGPVGDGRDGHIEFYIDGVLQATIDHPVPESPANVIIGVRQMSWTGSLNFSGTKTMLIDWLDITPIDAGSPNALAEKYSIFVGDSLSIASTNGVLVNDIGSGLSATLVSTTQHGTLTLQADGSFTYVPTNGFSGVDTFTYRADDGTANGESNGSVVTIEVLEPGVTDDTYSMVAGNVLAVAAPGVMVNDIGVSTVELVSDVSQGILTLNTNGSFSYTPPGGTFTGQETFTYRPASGVASTSLTATVTIDVIGDVSLEMLVDPAITDAAYILNTDGQPDWRTDIAATRDQVALNVFDGMGAAGTEHDFGLVTKSAGELAAEIGLSVDEIILDDIVFDSDTWDVRLNSWSASGKFGDGVNTGEFSVVYNLDIETAAGSYRYQASAIVDGSSTTAAHPGNLQAGEGWVSSGGYLGAISNANVKLSDITGISFSGLATINETPSNTSKSFYVLRSLNITADLMVEDGPADSDGDGMPDYWEAANGLNATNSADAGWDKDLDGIVNLDEYIAGMDPADSNSMFLVSIGPGAYSNNWFEIEWFSASNRLYSILESTNLFDWISVESGIPGTPPKNQRNVPVSAGASALYMKVEVELE